MREPFELVHLNRYRVSCRPETTPDGTYLARVVVSWIDDDGAALDHRLRPELPPYPTAGEAADVGRDVALRWLDALEATTALPSTIACARSCRRTRPRERPPTSAATSPCAGSTRSRRRRRGRSPPKPSAPIARPTTPRSPLGASPRPRSRRRCSASSTATAPPIRRAPRSTPPRSRAFTSAGSRPRCTWRSSAADQRAARPFEVLRQRGRSGRKNSTISFASVSGCSIAAK